mgnify:CR=1 FL=1
MCIRDSFYYDGFDKWVDGVDGGGSCSERLRAALELRPVDAEAYHELGVLLYRAAERVVWQVHKESPRIKPKPRRVPGDELTCWRSRLEPCFPVAGYGSRLDVAEEEMTERIGKDGSDTRAYLNLGTILRNQSMAAAIAAAIDWLRRIVPRLRYARVSEPSLPIRSVISSSATSSREPYPATGKHGSSRLRQHVSSSPGTRRGFGLIRGDSLCTCHTTRSAARYSSTPSSWYASASTGRSSSAARSRSEQDPPPSTPSTHLSKPS